MQDVETLQQLKLNEQLTREEKHHNNVATVVMGDERSASEQRAEVNKEAGEVMTALKFKYDELRDKLLIEVNCAHVSSRKCIVVHEEYFCLMASKFLCGITSGTDEGTRGAGVGSSV